MVKSALFFVLVITCYGTCGSGMETFLETVCQLQLTQGQRCNADTEKWYFDINQERCLNFTYHGCGGNANRFDTSDECVDSCQTSWFIRKNKRERTNKTPEVRDSNDCSQPPLPGRCKAIIAMWYWNPHEGRCDQFSYGGCGGTSNKFDTRVECEKYCGFL